MPLPKYRTGLYQVYKVCERFGILPPHCATTWTECIPQVKSELLAYESIRGQEENEIANQKAQASLS